MLWKELFSMRAITAGVASLTGVAALVLASTLPAVAAPAPGDAASGSATYAGSVVVNEFAPSGWLWHPTDEFVELHNTSNQTVMLEGWKMVACLSPSESLVVTTFGPVHVIDPGGYLLLAHIDYAGGGGGAPDGRYYVDVPDDGGWLLYDAWNGYVDGVGLRSGLACTEGSPAPECDWADGEAVTRNEQGSDTGDNADDFTCQARTPGS